MSKTLIAIPTHNAEDFVARTLRSCVNQTLKSEILVVDNCSTDRTREIVEKFQKHYDNIRLVVNERNLGRVGNWNRCLDLFDETSYEYIKFVFVGDELLPECVERVERVFKENENLSVVIWPYLFRNRDGAGSVSCMFGTSRRLTQADLVAEGLFPSNFTGAIICNTYAKRAIHNTRFHAVFLGGHTFSNEVVVRGDAYYLNEVLSVFNLDSHQSFHKQFNYLYVLETSYTRALGLEKNKDWIEDNKYQTIRDEIALESFLRQLEYFGNDLVFKLLRRLVSRWLLGVIGWFTRQPKRVYRKMRRSLSYLRKHLSEYRSIETGTKKPRLDFLVLYATTFCNAHCKICDVGLGAGDGIARPLVEAPIYLPLPLLEKILDDELIAGRKIYINFLMTEPLLAPELPKMLELCKQRGHTVKITTNGFLLTKRTKEISPYVDNVQVSLDGPPEIHDSIRGKGFFSAALEGIRALRNLNDEVEIEINYTVSTLNYFCIFDFLQLIDSQGIRVNMVKIQLLDFVSDSMLDKHNARFPDISQTSSSLVDIIDLSRIDTKELQRQLDLVRNFKPAFIQRIAFKPRAQTAKVLDMYFNPDGDPLPGWDQCLTPWHALAMNTTGKAFWHMRCFNDYILGDVNRESLRQIFYGESAEHFRKRFQESNFCFPACTRCCGVMPLE